MVEPSVSALIRAALIGSTRDPNARNIRIVVVVISSSTINGSLANRLWMLSCSSAGVPPTYSDSPLVGVMARRSSIREAASFRLTRPFWITRTEGSLDAPSRYGRSFHIASGLLSGSVKPLMLIALLRISATC